MVPVVKGDFTEEEAKGYRLADNKTGESAIWDNKKLLEELEGLEKSVYTGFRESGIFNDVLDESDKSPVEENEKGVTYRLQFKTQNKDLFEKVQTYITEAAGIEAE